MVLAVQLAKPVPLSAEKSSNFGRTKRKSRLANELNAIPVFFRER